MLYNLYSQCVYVYHTWLFFFTIKHVCFTSRKYFDSASEINEMKGDFISGDVNFRKKLKKASWDRDKDETLRPDYKSKPEYQSIHLRIKNKKDKP